MNRALMFTSILAAAVPFAAFAHGDGDGHDEHQDAAMSPDHHAMHDQMASKPLEWYGAVYMSLENRNPGTGGATNTFMTSDGTTLGLRGAIPLNYDLKGVWQVESEINLDQFGSGNTSELASGHNSFVGLQGDWGTVLAGKHNTPFFDATIQFDLFHHIAGDMRSILGTMPGVNSGSGADDPNNAFNTPASNMLMYKSQSYNGVSFSVGYFGFNETRAKDENSVTSATDGTKPRAFGGNVKYQAGPLTLVGAYEQHKNYDHYTYTDTGTTPETVTEESIEKTEGMVIGGMYHFNHNKTMVGAFFENLKLTNPANVTYDHTSRKAFYVNAQQRVDAWKFKAAVTKAGDMMDNDGATEFALGVGHELGAKAEVYVAYTMIKNKDNGTYGNDAVAPFQAGSDPKTVSTGVIFNF